MKRFWDYKSHLSPTLPFLGFPPLKRNSFYWASDLSPAEACVGCGLKTEFIMMVVVMKIPNDSAGDGGALQADIS